MKYELTIPPKHKSCFVARKHDAVQNVPADYKFIATELRQYVHCRYVLGWFTHHQEK